MIQNPLKLLIILGSNRPGRIGERVGKWIVDSLAAYPQFDVEFADLATIGLSLSMSPHHPRTGIYEGGHEVIGRKIGRRRRIHNRNA